MSWEGGLQFELEWTGKPAKSKLEKLKIEVNLEEYIRLGPKKVECVWVCIYGGACMLICVYRNNMKKNQNRRYGHAIEGNNHASVEDLLEVK